MSTLFISDLHLADERPDITETFLDFLNKLPHDLEDLYILGDFFEFWIGDDYLTPLSQEIIQALANLAKQNIKLYLMHGNRDFLLGKAFAKACHAKLLPDHHLIDLYGQRTLLMHGDTLCTQDVDYLKFRKRVRSRITQFFFLRKNITQRLSIAKSLRGESQSRAQLKADEIMDVTLQAVVDVMRKYKTTLLIHGHTHRPDVHELTVDNKPAKRIVLGSWEQAPQILYCDAHRKEMQHIPLL